MHYGSQATMESGTFYYRCPTLDCKKLLYVGSLITGRDWWQTKCPRWRCGRIVDTRGGFLGTQPLVFAIDDAIHQLKGLHVVREKVPGYAISQYFSRDLTVLNIAIGTPMATAPPRYSTL